MKALLLFAAVALASPAWAQDMNEQLVGLRRAGDEFAEAAALNSKSPALQSMAAEYREFSNNYSSLEFYVSNGNYEEAIRTLRRWEARTKNDQIKETLKQLLANLEKEQEKRTAKLTAELDALLKLATEKLATSKSPKDLQEIQQQLQDFRDYDLGSGGRSTRGLQERVSRAANFLENWQQILAAEKSGDLGEAVQNLRNLRQNFYAAGFADDKVLNAKMESLLNLIFTQEDKTSPLSPVSKAIIMTLEKIKNPEDAVKAQVMLRRLSSITSSSEESQLCNQAQNSVGQYLRMAQDYQSGAFARVISASNDYDFNYNKNIEALKAALRANAAAAANDVKDLGTPKEGESFAAFVRRKAGEAYQAKDWPDLFALLSVYSSATGGGCSRTQGMQDGVRAYLAGQQLEQAGQYKDAAASYSLCIAQVGPLVPRAEATEALNKMKANGKLVDAK